MLTCRYFRSALSRPQPLSLAALFNCFAGPRAAKCFRTACLQRMFAATYHNIGLRAQVASGLGVPCCLLAKVAPHLFPMFCFPFGMNWCGLRAKDTVFLLAPNAAFSDWSAQQPYYCHLTQRQCDCDVVCPDPAKASRHIRPQCDFIFSSNPSIEVLKVAVVGQFIFLWDPYVFAFANSLAYFRSWPGNFCNTAGSV